MTPRQPIHDVVDGLVTEAKASGYGSLAFAAGGPDSDVSYNICREFFGVSTVPDRMVDIASVSRPFEIIGAVIRFIKIYVIDVMKSRGVGIWDESQGDKRADIRHALLSFLAKYQMTVTRMMQWAGHYFAFAQHSASSRFVGNAAVKASDSTMVRDFVKPLVAGDRLPLFIGHNKILLMFPMIQTQRG